jgi:hypothetical protein
MSALLWIILFLAFLAIVYFAFVCGYKLGVASGISAIRLESIYGKKPTSAEVAREAVTLLKK